MMLYPKTIADTDADWRKACEFMQVIPLNPRKPSSRESRYQRAYYETADEFLQRPMVWEGNKYVPAAFYSYTLRFAVSLGVIGSIPVDATDQLNEFRRAVNAALKSRIGMLERRSWELDDERVRLDRAGDHEAAAKVVATQVATGNFGVAYGEMFEELRAETGRTPTHPEILNAILSVHGKERVECQV